MNVGAILDVLIWTWPYVTTAVHLALAVAASAHVVLYKRDVRAAIGWSGLIWLAPILGSMLYVTLGINRIRRRAARLRPEAAAIEGEAIVTGSSSAAPADGVEPSRAPSDAGAGLARLSALLASVTGRPRTVGNDVRVLVNGDAAYPAMLEAIDCAERSIGLCTYIFDDDRAGMEFVRALGRAVARGVEVRVLVDAIGVRYSRPRITRPLREHGVPTARFLPSLLPLRSPYVNLRNHRKILVVDGHIGFTGGMNIREGCQLARQTAHAVQDLHFRFQGPVVQQILEEFVFDWEFVTQESLEREAWKATTAAAGRVAARAIPDGPDENFEAIRWALLGALVEARRSVRIVTPYFLPDQTLIAALNLAAMCGVRVEIVMPERSNLRLVQWAVTAQLWQVLQGGCRVWLSKPPFDHTKLMLVDDEWALVGSANWDARSLRLNFELDVECHDAELARQLSRLVDDKIAHGRSVGLDDVNGRSLPIRLRDGIARLASPYL